MRSLRQADSSGNLDLWFVAFDNHIEHDRLMCYPEQKSARGWLFRSKTLYTCSRLLPPSYFSAVQDVFLCFYLISVGDFREADP